MPDLITSDGKMNQERAIRSRLIGLLQCTCQPGQSVRSERSTTQGGEEDDP